MDWPMEPELLALCLWNRACPERDRVRMIGFVWVTIDSWNRGKPGREMGKIREWQYPLDFKDGFFIHASLAQRR